MLDRSMNWLISANSKIYHHASSFEHYGYIDWKQNQTRYKVGDTVYIYCTQPTKRVRYRCLVEQIGIPFANIRDDKAYWLDLGSYKEAQSGDYFRLRLQEQIDSERLTLELLLQHGLKAAPQGPKKLDGSLLTYIESEFKSDSTDFFPDSIPDDSEIREGMKMRVVVNKYERSSIARAMCIEHHGCSCTICEFDFEQAYGPIGKGFIHVHHVIPIHAIGKEYKIDYRNDLIPVCPNCHAMLHRKLEGMTPSIEELKEMKADLEK